LASLMGGAIGLTSSAGVGSSFWFTTRLETEGFEASATRPLVAGERPLRALCADRGSLTLAWLDAQLRPLGLEVEIAPDAEVGLRRLHAAARAGEPFDLALVDW